MALWQVAEPAQAVSIQATFADGAGVVWSDRQKATVQAAIGSWTRVLGRHLPSGTDPVIQARFTFRDISSLGNWSGAFTVAPGTDVYPWTPGVTHTITFDSSRLFQFYFDDDVSTFGDVPSNRFDAYTIAMHEIGHLLGFAAGFYLDDVGLSSVDKWLRHVSAGRFDPGGLNVPLAPDNDHLSATDPLTASLLMAPGLGWMERREISDLEAQMLVTAYGYELLPEPATSILLGMGLCFLAAHKPLRDRRGVRNSRA